MAMEYSIREIGIGSHGMLASPACRQGRTA